MNTGELLKKCRVMAGLSKAEASVKAEITDKTYRRYENGYDITDEKFHNILSSMGARVEVTKVTRITMPDFSPMEFMDKITQ